MIDLDYSDSIVIIPVITMYFQNISDFCYVKELNHWLYDFLPEHSKVTVNNKV